MRKIGQLEIRTVGTGKNRTRVALLPGHKYRIEHFLPQNQEAIRQLSQRVFVFRTKYRRTPFTLFRRKFIVKGEDTRRSNTLTPVSEARLAMYINSLKLRGIHVEQPLAVIQRNGKTEVVYRKINLGVGLDHESRFTRRRIDRLREHGIYPDDEQPVLGLGKIYFIDLEYWKVTEELKKKLKLRYKRC